MGANFVGHALPGCFVLLYALWWVFRHGPRMRERKDHQDSAYSYQLMAAVVRVRSTDVPLPSFLMPACGVILFLREMYQNRWHVHMDTYTHMTSYALFALPALVELATVYASKWGEQVPPFFTSLAYATFIGGIGVLFSFHLDGRDELDVRIHTILYSWALVMGAIHLLECGKPRSHVLVLLRIFSYFVFGFWLIW